jgi:hypothetical protein
VRYSTSTLKRLVGQITRLSKYTGITDTLYNFSDVSSVIKVVFETGHTITVNVRPDKNNEMIFVFLGDNSEILGEAAFGITEVTQYINIILQGYMRNNYKKYPIEITGASNSWGVNVRKITDCTGKTAIVYKNVIVTAIRYNIVNCSNAKLTPSGMLKTIDKVDQRASFEFGTYNPSLTWY